MDQDYWRALDEADRGAALEVVKRLRDSGRTALQIVEELVVPAQERIGERRLDGDWTVERERAATAINEGIVHWLGSFAPSPDPSGPLVLVSCIEGERHALPALVVAETLQAAGYRVEYAGGDPDPDELLRQVRVLEPRAVLFSASLTSSLARQKHLFGSIRAVGIPVLVGGQAFGGDGRRARSLGATAYAPTVEDVLRMLEELPERVPAERRPEEGPADAEAAWILGYRGHITPVVVRAVERRYAGRGERWRVELDSHVDHVLGCLASALVTGDETIVVEVRDWLARVLARRGAPRGLVAEIWGLLAEPLRGHPLAHVHLAAAALPSPVELDEGLAPARAASASLTG